MIYIKSCGSILLLSVFVSFGLSMATHEGVRIMVQYSESVATSDGFAQLLLVSHHTIFII